MRQIGVLAHKTFVRDVPPALRPDIHACLQKLEAVPLERWHSAGVRVKKLAAFPYPVFEARLNRGDRLVFTLHNEVSESFDGLHVVLWCAGHHDDAVRMAGRRMGLPDAPEIFDVSEEKDEPIALPLCTQRALPGMSSLVEIDEGDIDRWAESQIDPILHLTPEQRALTRGGEDRPVFLRGGVGTGKTTVLLYRMLKLLMAGSIVRPAFLTYSRSLAGWCRSVFERLPGWDRFHVEFTSLSGLLRSQFGETRGGKRLFRKAWQQLGHRGDPEAAWWELQRLRGSAAFHGKQPQSGDDLPDHVDAPVKAAYTAYRRHLDGHRDVLDLAWRAYEYYRAPSASLPFDAIFIDEAQDLTPIEWLVCILMGDRPRLAFFCADEAQDIRDTRFSWDGVEAAMRLVGHRAPPFSYVELHGNRRNPGAIAAFLQKISERFDLGASVQGEAAPDGSSPMVCVGTPEVLEKLARQAGCPVMLDLASRTDEDRGKFFWSLDLDHIKGLEFHELLVWAPAAVWPVDKHLARKLTTAVSRALQGVVIFTDATTAPRFEELGAVRVSPGEVESFLLEHREPIGWDRESMARWQGVTYAQAAAWVDEGVCAWTDFRSLIGRWAGQAPLALVTSWVRDGLCTWEPFRGRMREWSRWVAPDLAASWVRDGHCLAEEFAPRLSGWVHSASYGQALSWVEGGLMGWEDFGPRLRLWIPEAPLSVAEAWVASGGSDWRELGGRIPAWRSEASFSHARAWVSAGAATWEAFRERLGDWYGEVDFATATGWVNDELCSWKDLPIARWFDEVGWEVAERWVEAGHCTWELMRHRLREWVSKASFEQASSWVSDGFCGWGDFAGRLEGWAGLAEPEQGIAWLEEGICAPSALWPQVPRWRAELSYGQALSLVEAGVCHWGAFAPRLGEWTGEVPIEHGTLWVARGLMRWKDFEGRIEGWKGEASLEQATAWVRDGLCAWKDFEGRIEEWKGEASLDQASDWADAGLVTWESFTSKLPRWVDAAETWRVEQWRQKGLISKQMAKAALRRRRS
jgi:hypothetical protein